MTDVTTLDELAALYGAVNPNSLRKEVPQLTSAYRSWMERSPFVAIATSGPGGLDCSPRGDPAGQLIRVLDEQTIALPDRRGNNRLDTLRNIVADPRVALLFLVPGVNETLRVNGRARLTTDMTLREPFAVAGKLPVTVIVVSIEAVYFQCARALMRSSLWDVTKHIARGDVPTAGEMSKSADETFDAATYDAELLPRQKASLY